VKKVSPAANLRLVKPCSWQLDLCKAIQQVQRVRTLLKDNIPNQKIQPTKIESIVEALTTNCLN